MESTGLVTCVGSVVVVVVVVVVSKLIGEV